MDRDLAKELFRKARDQYDTALRTSSIILAACLLFHLMLYGPYIDVHARHSRTEAEIAGLAARNLELEDFSGRLSRSADATEVKVEDALSRLVSNLRSDFGKLDLTIVAIKARAEFGADAFGGEIQAPNEPQPSPQAQYVQTPVQMQAPQDAGGPQFFQIEDQTLITAIEEAPTVYLLRERLQAFVEREIVGPGFAEANRVWTETALPEFSQTLDSILARLKEPTNAFASDPGTRAELEQSLEELKIAAKAIEFKPPEDEFWWASVEGKEMMALGIRGDVGQQIENPDVLHTMAAQIGKTLEMRQELAGGLEEELAALEGQFESLQADLASMGGSFKSIAVNLEGIVARFPLLLALCLGWITVWTAKRANDLALATRMLAQVDDSGELWDWFQARVRLIGATGSSATDAWALGSVLLVWIGLATFQLSGMPDVSPLRIVVTGGAGLTLALGALHYRRRAMTEVLAVSPPGPDSRRVAAE